MYVNVCGHHAHMCKFIILFIISIIIIMKTNVKQSVFCALSIYSIQRSALSFLCVELPSSSHTPPVHKSTCTLLAIVHVQQRQLPLHKERNKHTQRNKYILG